MGSNEPVHCGLNEPLAGFVRFYCKHLMMLIKRVSVIFQQGLKFMPLKHCDFILSSLEVVRSGVK